MKLSKGGLLGLAKEKESLLKNPFLFHRPVYLERMEVKWLDGEEEVN